MRWIYFGIGCLAVATAVLGLCVIPRAQQGRMLSTCIGSALVNFGFFGVMTWGKRRAERSSR